MNDLLHRFYTPAYPRERMASFAQLVEARPAVAPSKKKFLEYFSIPDAQPARR
jgi:hypothetical protein